MSKSDIDKSIELITKTEELADKILSNKQELKAMDKRRQDTRQAMRLINNSEDKKVWITIGSMLVKVQREKSLALLKKDQEQIELEINLLYSEQKVLVNKHRDLEFKSAYSGTHLKALDRKEFDALKANLPLLVTAALAAKYPKSCESAGISKSINII